MPEEVKTRIKKIKFTKDDKIIIEYEKPTGDGYDKYRFTSAAPAAPSFYEAMKMMGTHTVTLCELPESYLGRITMKSVTYTYKGDEEVMGATMAVTMELYHSDSVIALNTPHKPSAPYDPNATEPYGDKALPEKCVEALWELARQAELYIGGERGQMSLFDNAEAEDVPVTDDDETAQDDAEEPIDDEAIPGMGNVINMPFVANSQFGNDAHQTVM